MVQNNPLHQEQPYPAAFATFSSTQLIDVGSGDRL
jgi:hypothetical protein